MTEHVNVEFTVVAGKRQPLIDALQALDEQNLIPCEGWRADDYVQRREALVKFNEAMEVKLRRNEQKRNWADQSIEGLMRLMLIEVEKAKVLHEFNTPEGLQASLVDIANWCLFVWSRLNRQ